MGDWGVNRIQGAVERYDRSYSLWVKSTTQTARKADASRYPGTHQHTDGHTCMGIDPHTDSRKTGTQAYRYVHTAC